MPEHPYEHIEGFEHVEDMGGVIGCAFDALVMLLHGMAKGCDLCPDCVCAALHEQNWIRPAPWMLECVAEGKSIAAPSPHVPILRPDENMAFAVAMWACCLVAGTTGPTSAAPMLFRCSAWLQSPEMARWVDEFDLPEAGEKEPT